MKVLEYLFHSYYHQYITIEADVLTDKLKHRVQVNEDDCFALCTGYCQEGELMFAVLSIGPSWEDCTKGLDDPEMLGVFTMEEVCDKTARIVEPDMKILRKGSSFLKNQEKNDDEEVLELRKDRRLDEIRDAQFPDIVDIGVNAGGKIVQAKACLLGTEGVFVHAVLVADPDDEETSYEPYEDVWALPCVSPTGMGLIALVVGDHELTKVQEALLAKAKELADQHGLSFTNVGKRS